MNEHRRGDSSTDEPVRARLDELLADMEEVLTGLPAKRLDPNRDQGIAQLSSSGIYDMRDMATAYELKRCGQDLDEEEEMPVGGPVENILTPCPDDPRRPFGSLVYFYAGALGVLLVALTAVATTILVRAS